MLCNWLYSSCPSAVCSRTDCLAARQLAHSCTRCLHVFWLFSRNLIRIRWDGKATLLLVSPHWYLHRLMNCGEQPSIPYDVTPHRFDVATLFLRAAGNGPTGVDLASCSRKATVLFNLHCTVVLNNFSSLSYRFLHNFLSLLPCVLHCFVIHSYTKF